MQAKLTFIFMLYIYLWKSTSIRAPIIIIMLEKKKSFERKLTPIESQLDSHHDDSLWGSMIEGIVRPPRNRYSEDQLGQTSNYLRRQVHQGQGKFLHQVRTPSPTPEQENPPIPLRYRKARLPCHPLPSWQCLLQNRRNLPPQVHARQHLPRLLRFHGLWQKLRVLDY